MSPERSSRPRVAIVGGGISGLACAHYLRGDFAVDLYERASRLGGHVNARTVIDPAGRSVALETGFLAFHRSRYPTLSALLDHFAIPTGPSGVGLTVWDQPEGLCYRQSEWFQLFGTRLPAELRAQFSALLGLIFRHEKRPEAHPYPNVRLDAFLAERGCHPALARQVLVPSISALWGFQPTEVMAMSSATVLESLARFVGQTHDEPFERIVPSTDAWLSVLVASLDARLFTDHAVSAVAPAPDGGAQLVVNGEVRRYDAVVLAVHADQALRLLESPTAAQRRVLGAIPYNRTAAIVHDDARVLPTQPGGPSEYTYTLLGDHGAETAMTTWHMGRIQGTAAEPPWLVSVGPPDLAERGWIDPERVRYQVIYEHPAMVPGAIAAQDALSALNESGPMYFCGSYFGLTGSNECAVASALAVSRRLRAAGDR